MAEEKYEQNPETTTEGTESSRLQVTLDDIRSASQESRGDGGTSTQASDKNLVHFVDKAGNILTRKLYKGVTSSIFPFLEANIENMRKVKIRPDDVIILAYQKCGTHWLWEIVNMLRRTKAQYINGNKKKHFLEETPPEVIEKSASPRVLNTHLFPHCITPELIDGRCKIIFLTRNPKDVFVSEYNHYRESFYAKYHGDFSEFFDILMTKNPNYLMGTWIEYTKAWDAYFEANPQLSVLYLYYEDMKEDLPREVRAIADFLSLSVDDRLIDEISEKTTFINMKRAKTAQEPTQAVMYKTGIAGKWKDYFTVAMNERYDREYDEEMADSRIAARIRFSL